MMNGFYKYLFLILIAGVFFSCKREIIEIKPDPPFNPFDTITYTSNGTSSIQIDSNSFLGLHTYIFSTKCAVPGCHDGSFEPDFRTVQSAYNTLVYHPVIKNSPGNTFEYRVVPFDTAKSWMHERVTTDNVILGKMPLYDTLYPHQIKKIEQWILEGAKDIFDNVPKMPNYQPSTFGLVAFKDDTTGIRLDTVRARIIDPFHVPKNSQVNIWFGLYDDKDLPFLFQHNKLKISDNPVDFSNATEYNLNVSFTPFFAPSILGGNLPYFHSVKINTTGLIPGKVYYMRLYVMDLDHSIITEIPETGSQLYLITYFSFIVDP